MKHFKMTALAACAVLAFGFAACSSDDDSSSNNSGYIGTKSPSKAKAVGDIVFSDGSATPYREGSELTEVQKSKAIAVIFYVGTELNSDVDGVADTTTTRTLGVGLVHDKHIWCTESANAVNINITTIQCPHSGSSGTLTFTGDKNGSDNLEQIGAYLLANGSSDDTAIEENYPAFYFAKKYATREGSHVSGTDYEKGWYLPTVAELFQLWKNRYVVVDANRLCQGTEFVWSPVAGYYSSSQLGWEKGYAYCLTFYGDWKMVPKTDWEYLCAVREF